MKSNATFFQRRVTPSRLGRIFAAGLLALIGFTGHLLYTSVSVWAQDEKSDGRATRASGADSLVPFVSIGRGTASRIVDPLEIVIQSEQELRDFWTQHVQSDSLPPLVDFATDLVAGIFAGQRPTAGYQVEIVRIDRNRAGIHVIYQIKNPPKDAVVAQVFTQPFHLIRLPRLNLPIQFKRL
ncbi:MAG: hypothetical protein C3F12_08915 [Candidatus Methylomirabilota bacterium]|nr:protease complex subunit PrcB family protein [candidate division NC10 bacterium]PWB46163.1 MAG: hypothetical protein C3F12_08915 [candidate division NC10 bacterium]